MEPIHIDHKGRAAEYLRQADSLIRGNCFGSSSQHQKEEALEYLEKAGNQYKLDKDWNDSLKAYIRAVDLAIELKHYNATKFCMEVVSMYNKINNIDGQLFYLQKAAVIYGEGGQGINYAKVQKDIGEIFEKQQANPKKAIEHYKNAADAYDTERNHSISATSMNLKIADLLLAHTTDIASLTEAKRIYENISTNIAVDSPSRFHVRGYLFNAVLAMMVLADNVAARRAYDKYCIEFALFNKSDEAELCKQLLDSVDNEDAEALTQAVTKYAQTNIIDALRTKTLLTIKERLIQTETISL